MRKLEKRRWRDSLPGAAITGVITAAVSYFAFRGQAAVALSVDAISQTQDTVWSRGVVSAFILGFIASCLSARRFQKALAQSPAHAGVAPRPFFPFVVGVALRNAMLLFGTFVVIALFWQRLLGTVEVTPGVAAALVGCLAALVAGVAEVRTKRAILHDREHARPPPGLPEPLRA